MYIQIRLINPRLVSFVVLTILTMMLVVPAANAQSTVGTITQVQGTANIQRGAANIVVAPNLPVQLQDRITTQPGASVTIGLVDNSSLQLGPSTTLTIDESVAINGVGAPSKVGLLGGSLHSVIVGAMRSSSPALQVQTPNAVAAVHGTEWSETYSESSRDGYTDCRQFTDVDVQDGTVNVTICPQTGGASEDVHAGGHKTVACCGGAALLPVDHSVEYLGLGVLGVGGVTLGVLCATETWDWCAGSNEHGGEEHHHHSSHM
jgi:ferric-dicitrate binding protein FerR (iron transport regulator)